MDTSKTYIKMCNHPKIQEQWKPNEWDRVIDYHDFYSPKGRSKKGYLWAILPKRIADSGIYGPYLDENKKIEDDRYHKMLLWLPYQDQIQEMLGIKGLCQNWIFFLRFYIDTNWVITNYGLKFKTQEQIWLAFLMWEKFGKIWNHKKECWEDGK